MTDHSMLQALVAQAWQLAALAIAVAVCVRCAARNRPHLGSLLIDVVRFNLLPDLGVTPAGIKDGLEPKPAYMLITPRVIDAAEAKPPKK